MDIGFVLFLHTHGQAFAKYVYSRKEAFLVVYISFGQLHAT